MWKEAVVAYYKVYTGIFLEVLRENHEILISIAGLRAEI
jgi:hypothetical protein